MKYRPIVIPAQDNASCEIFQRMAFSFGYAWTSGLQSVGVIDTLDWLQFDPNSKLIQPSVKSKLPANATIVSNVTELLVALSNPQPVNTVVRNTANTLEAEIVGGGVSFKHLTSRRTLTVDNEILKLAAEAAGLLQKPVAPLVKFEYPEKERAGLPKLRFVRLTQMDDVYLKGYEVESANSKAVGEFKNFLRNRILNAGLVQLVKFSM